MSLSEQDRALIERVTGVALNPHASVAREFALTLGDLYRLIGAARAEGDPAAEGDIPSIIERGQTGERLSPTEQSAWTGYELGWKDGLKHAISDLGECFECGHDLNGPYCPACNPALSPPAAEEERQTAKRCRHGFPLADDESGCIKCGEEDRASPRLLPPLSAEGVTDSRARVELDIDSCLPQVRIISEQTWITWSPSVSAFGVDIPVEQLVQQAKAFVVALSPPAAEMATTGYVQPLDESRPAKATGEWTDVWDKQPAAEPVETKGWTIGWAALASNGNIRLWKADKAAVQMFAFEHDCEVVRLVRPEPATTDVEREEIARVIDPAISDIGFKDDCTCLNCARYELAFDKADQIKALFASKSSGSALSQPCANGSPDPILTDGQHSDGGDA